MKKFVFLTIIIILSLNCKNERKINHFDEIYHYALPSEMSTKNSSVKRFNEIFSSVYGHKINLKTFEKELISFAYTKNTIPKEKIQQVDEFVTNDIFYKSHLTACIPSYRDVLILKKNHKIVSVLKLCFECGMVDKYGALKSQCNKIDNFENYFMNFENFYKTLHGKTYER
ncbi:MAG: hypothetical protein H7239_11920 [Flavobacterium sp.]|nr:hypothetical protein [Flavobacterium sp.]